MNNYNIQNNLIKICKKAAREYDKCPKCGKKSKVASEKRIKFETLYSLIERFNLVNEYEKYSLPKKCIKGYKSNNRSHGCEIIINLK